MNRLTSLLLLPVLALAFCPELRAQVQINKIDWQSSRVEGKTVLPFEAIGELKLAPYQKYPNKFRAVVTAQNSSAKPVDGLVLRCALSLHLTRISDAADGGFWAVPFHTEEVRISQIKPAGIYEAKLVHIGLNEQLNKLRNTGFWIDAIKLQVMLDPRPGDEPSRIMKEAVISVKKP